MRERGGEREEGRERGGERKRERGGGEIKGNLTSISPTTTHLNLELQLNVTAVLRILLKLVKTSELLRQVVSCHGLRSIAL